MAVGVQRPLGMRPAAGGHVPFSETGLPPTALLIVLFLIVTARWMKSSEFDASSE